MREILFRGKRKKGDKRWVEGDLLHGYSGFGITNRYYAGSSFEVVPETVGQYTGLTDKNGNKIFEGDILKNTLSNSTCIVKWSKTHNAFTLEIQGDIYGFTSIGNKVYEVIGNIYDSPELRSKNGRRC